MQTPETKAGIPRRLAAAVLYLAIPCWGVYHGFSPAVTSGLQRLQVDPGDTVLNHYILEHTFLWAFDADHPGTLWSPPFYFPQQGHLAYSENLLGAAPVYWGLRTAFDPVHSYQLWMMLMTLADFAAMAWVLRRFGTGHLLTVAGAYLFAFGMPFITQLNHQQLLPRMFSPLALYFAWRMLTEPTTRRLACFWACWYLQLLSCIYLGWMLTFCSAVLAVVACWSMPGTTSRLWVFARGNWLAVCLTAISTAVLSALIIMPYLEANEGFRRHWGSVVLHGPRLSSWLTAPHGTFWHRALDPINDDSGNSERWLFLGFGSWVLFATAGISLRYRRDDMVRCLLVSGLVVVLLVTLWPGNWSLWWFVWETLPGARGIRATARIFVLVYALFIIGGAVGVHRLLAGRRVARLVVPALLGFACVAEQSGYTTGSFTAADTYGRAEELATRIDQADVDLIYVEHRDGTWFVGEELIGMWAGLQARVPCINGHTGRTLPRYPEWAIFSANRIDEWLKEHDWHGRLGIVHPDGSVSVTEY